MPEMPMVHMISLVLGIALLWTLWLKEKSGGCSSVAGLPALPVVTLMPTYNLSFHPSSFNQDPFSSSVEDIIR